MLNKYQGKVPLVIQGKTYHLQFTWAAIAEIQSHFADVDISELFKTYNLEKISVLLEIGFKADHPEMTKDAIMKASPPLVLAVAAMRNALNYAYFGPDVDNAPEEETDQKKVLKKKKK